MNVLRHYIDIFQAGRDLEPGDAETFLDALINETDEDLLAELFYAWNEKEIAEGEIYEIARILRGRCTSVPTRHTMFVDIVGTGGSKAKTFNVSTAAAFVVAGCGVPVAKHGNRSATSSSGSADVLAVLGIDTSVDAESAGRNLDEIGICFMFAPNFHRLSPTLAGVRRALGFPTIFNCVGPLCNPARAPHQIIGVWNEELVTKMANALKRLGTKKSWIVYGREGLDEVSATSTTVVHEVVGETVRPFEMHLPAAGGSIKEFRARSPHQSAEIITSVLSGEQEGRPPEMVVAVNAAAALCVAGRADGIDDGLQIALESIRNGSGLEKLEALANA